MSALEEAREQAREALELVHAWRQREQAWDTPRALDFERIGVSIRALLDATDPQEAVEPAEDEREALVNVIRLFFQNWRAIGRVSPSLEVSIDSLEGAVDDLIELDAPKDGDYHEGFEEGVKVGRAGSGPRPITDEMVEAGVHAAWSKRTVGIGGQVVYGPSPEMYRMVRVALEAAEEARR